MNTDQVIQLCLAVSQDRETLCANPLTMGCLTQRYKTTRHVMAALVRQLEIPVSRRYRRSPLSGRYITRLDNPEHHLAGFQVRIRTHGISVSRYFADGKHEGTKGALKAATAFRDSQLDQITRTP